ncbi:MAG: SGNH/GDSL hydrolase family protein, partial [Hominilimicola sp.]
EITIIGSQLIAKFNNGEYKVVEFAEAPTTITSINASTSQNGGSGSGATDLIMSSKITVDKNKVEIVGDDEFATITGKTVTRQYSAKSYVPEASDSFTWEVTQAEGVSIDAQSGLLSVTDDATPGTVTVTATSGTKTGSMDVTITAVSTYTATVEYPKAVQKGESAKLTVTRITDALGDDVTEYFSPVWSIDNAPDVDKTLDYTGLTPGEATAVYAIYDGAVLASVESEIVTVAEDGKLSVTAPSDAKVYIWDSLNGMKPVSAEVKSAPVTTLESTQLAAIGSRSGNLITNSGAESGTVTVKLNITGSDAAPTAYDIAVDNYSKIVDYTVELTSVSVADLVDDSTITGYQVTVADADGNQLAQEVVQASGSEVAVPTVSDGTPAKVEVAPVFTATDSISSTSDERYAFNVPAAAYDITVTMSGSRADLYVNNQLVVNNMLQYASQPPYTDVMHDVVVSEGYAKMITTDYSSGKGAADSPISKLQIVKSPSIVTRKTKIYVMGDSLVAKYYEDADKMTGWGQVLQNYITDDIEVVDIANSGACTVDIAGTQLTRIIGSAQPGDYVVLESGYNDKGHKDTHGMTVEIMKERVSYMVNAMKAKGVKVILVTPNASAHDYNNSVAWASGILDSANELNVDYINLSKLSYDFLYGKYGADFTANETLTHTYNIYRTNENGLHSTVNAANCWAAIIAAELEKLDIGVETTNYEYQFNDGTNDITVSVANMSN